MLKAIFMDYTGTLVQERGPEIEKVIMKICENSILKNPKEVLALWWRGLKQYEESSYKTAYCTEDEIVDRLLNDFEKNIQMKADKQELHSMIRDFWIHAPLFEDVLPFFEKCPYPVYVITNNGVQYVRKGLAEKNVFPAGIVCADMVQAYKPHKELFEKALEVSGCKADEVIHIGDSYDSDVAGAASAGIKAVLIQRQAKQERTDVTCIHRLSEVFEQFQPLL